MSLWEMYLLRVGDVSGTLRVFWAAVFRTVGWLGGEGGKVPADAAEEVCWTLCLLVALCEVDTLPVLILSDTLFLRRARRLALMAFDRKLDRELPLERLELWLELEYELELEDDVDDDVENDEPDE